MINIILLSYGIYIYKRLIIIIVIMYEARKKVFFVSARIYPFYKG